MYQLHPANRRGRTYTGWLDSYHTFSFGSYHDPRYMNFGSLRVINDDIVAPGAGFDMHPHDNMEHRSSRKVTAQRQSWQR